MNDRHTKMTDQAALWVARMDGGDWDEEREAALQAWLDRDPRHPGALLHAQAAWMMLDRPEDESGLEPSEKAANGPPTVTRRVFIGAGGAAIAASFAGAFVLFGRSQTISTEVGEIRRVPLADGSVAAINTASRLSISIADDRRNVALDRGEAWFQVARDPARPFTVEAGRVRVQAVGTAFSVRRTDGGAEVLVTEGIVEAWVAGAEGHRARFTAGEMGFITKNAAITRKEAEPEAVDRALAWRRGRIDLQGVRLDEAAAEFNRYNSREIQIVDPSIAGERFDGLFQIDDPEGFALAVRASLDVPVDVSSPTMIRIGRAPT